MIVGVLREVKSDEYRVGLLPVGAELLVRDGHTVLVEKDAGEESGFENDRYLAVGAKIVETAVINVRSLAEPLGESFLLCETGPDTGVFSGWVPVSGHQDATGVVFFEPLKARVKEWWSAQPEFSYRVNGIENAGSLHPDDSLTFVASSSNAAPVRKSLSRRKRPAECSTRKMSGRSVVPRRSAGVST